MIKLLISIANKLDKKGFYKEANILDTIIKKASNVVYTHGMPIALVKKINTYLPDDGDFGLPAHPDN